MKPLALALVLCALCASPALAQDKKTLSPQQKKMAECSGKAKGLKGDEYRKVRDACLKGESAAAAGRKLTPQQQKMAECNARAKGLKGEAFKKARNDCLKG